MQDLIHHDHRAAITASVEKGGFVYALFSLAAGSPHLQLVSLCQRKVRDAEEPASLSTVLQPSHLGPMTGDVLKEVSGYLDVFSLAQMRATNARLREAAVPQETHVLPAVGYARRLAALMCGQTAPCIGVLSMQGRTEASRRYVVVHSTPRTAVPLAKAYFLSVRNAIGRELAASIAEADSSAPEPVTLSVSDMPEDTALSTMVQAAFAGTVVSDFWEWCHPTVAGQHRPQLQLA